MFINVGIEFLTTLLFSNRMRHLGFWRYVINNVCIHTLILPREFDFNTSLLNSPQPSNRLGHTWLCTNLHSPEEVSQLCSEAHGATMRVRVVTDFAHVPALPPYDVHREGMLLDTTCSDVQLVLQEVNFRRTSFVYGLFCSLTAERCPGLV